MKKLLIILVILAAILLSACDSTTEPTLPIFPSDATTVTESPLQPFTRVRDGQIDITDRSGFDEAIPGRSHTVALSLPRPSQPRTVLAAGDSHTVLLRPDGTVRAVGRNDDGQLDVYDWSEIVEVAASDFHTVGLKADGTVMATGNNSHGQLDVGGWSDIVAISAGGYVTVGLRADGTVVAVGDNRYGQINVGCVACLDDVDCFICWSSIDVGCNVCWIDIVAIATGGIHTIGLRADGTVAAVGLSYNDSTRVSGWRGIVAIATGERHTLGLKYDGTVVGTGSNLQGAIRGTREWDNIVALVAYGVGSSVGLRADGTVVVAGYNLDRGDRGIHYLRTPRSWSEIVAVATGYSHTVGLRADGTLVGMGSNDEGQLDLDRLLEGVEEDAPTYTQEIVIERDTEDLFARINELRAEASQPLFVRHEGLDRIALEYATQIFFDADARSGDFQSLPNGDRVISLAHMLDVAVTGFDYSVFLGFSIGAMEDTNEFISKAIYGDFTRVGIVWVGEYDGFSSMVIIVYDNATGGQS